MSIALHLRPLSADDAAFLREALYEAIFVPPGEPPLPRSLIDQPELAQYIHDFGSQAGDTGIASVIKEQPVGAAWARLIQGSGFIDAHIPELSIAVLSGYRDGSAAHGGAIRRAAPGLPTGQPERTTRQSSLPLVSTPGLPGGQGG
jgi:hypothetical protein